MPERSAGCGFESFNAAAARKEDHAAGRRCEADAVRDFVAPLHLAGFVIDGIEEGAPVGSAAGADSTEAHGAARIRFKKIADAQTVLLMHVEEPGIRREGGRRKVQ